MTNHEPSNAELMQVLKGHIEQADARDRAYTEKTAHISTMLQTQSNQIISLTQRVTAVETGASKAAADARRALDSQAELEGNLLAEVGALGANDRKQNAEMADIKKETEKQSLVLDKVKLESSAQTTALAEILTWKRAAILLFTGVPTAWVIIQQLLEHWKP